MTLATTVQFETREAWLAARRQSIGASEAAAALGLSPYCSPHELYCRKIGKWQEQPETEAMVWGLRLEPLLAQAYTERTGRAIVATQVYYRGCDPYSFLSATLDGINSEGTPVEFKTTSAWKRGSVGEEGTDEIPDHWTIQAHMQMFLSEASAVEFGVLIGGQEFRTFRVERSEELIANMLPRLAAFWRCVETRTPPDWGIFETDPKILAALYGDPAGSIDLDSAADIAAERYEELGAEIRLLEGERKQVEAFLRHSLGEHEVGALPGGRIVKRYRQEMPERTQTVKAHTRDYIRILKSKETR